MSSVNCYLILGGDSHSVAPSILVVHALAMGVHLHRLVENLTCLYR